MDQQIYIFSPTFLVSRHVFCLFDISICMFKRHLKLSNSRLEFLISHPCQNPLLPQSSLSQYQRAIHSMTTLFLSQPMSNPSACPACPTFETDIALHHLSAPCINHVLCLFQMTQWFPSVLFPSLPCTVSFTHSTQKLEWSFNNLYQVFPISIESFPVVPCNISIKTKLLSIAYVALDNQTFGHFSVTWIHPLLTVLCS